MIFIPLILIILFPIILFLISLVFITNTTTYRNIALNRTPALLFHSINNKKENGVSHISTSVFEQLLDELNKRDIKTITVSESAKKKYDNSVVLVFDDGFEDFYKEAFPLLKRYNHKATIYPVAKSVNEKFSWDIYSNRSHLSAEQLVEISEHNIEIGSHSLSHPDLIRISDTELIKELKESKIILEKIIGKKINSLSFPFGSWNEHIWKEAKKLGYKSASAYRKHKHSFPDVINVIGIYSFDNIGTLLEKCNQCKIKKTTLIRTILMPHFAKGTALWNYRKNYSLFSR